MTLWQKYRSYFWEVKLKKYHSDLNGDLFVNIEYGKKVLHTSTANYSYQNLHKVLKIALESIRVDWSKNTQILNLGLGGGSTVQILREDFSCTGDIVSVEHDPVIVEIAKSDFNIERYGNHEIVIQDALDYVESLKVNSQNLIICDLFKDKEVPEKFKTKSFFDSLLQALQPNGYLIFNFIVEKNKPIFFQSFLDSNMPGCTFDILEPVKGNHVLICRKR